MGYSTGEDWEEKGDEQVPLVSIDYMFMSDSQEEGEEKGMPVLVAKDRKSKVIRARVIPQKGANAYVVRLLGGILEFGVQEDRVES